MNINEKLQDRLSEINIPPGYIATEFLKIRDWVHDVMSQPPSEDGYKIEAELSQYRFIEGNETYSARGSVVLQLTALSSDLDPMSQSYEISIGGQVISRCNAPDENSDIFEVKARCRLGARNTTRIFRGNAESINDVTDRIEDHAIRFFGEQISRARQAKVLDDHRAAVENKLRIL